MVVLFVHLVQEYPFDKFQNEIITNEIMAIGAYDFLVIDSFNFLEAVLETYDGRPVLIFTNFPPDNFFERQGIDTSNYDIDPFNKWPVELYSFSASLFRHICINNEVVGIQYITSALREIVSDNHFRLITDGTNTYSSIIRRRKWMQNSKIEYNILLKKYMLTKISEAIEYVDLTFPCHKQLVNNPIIHFCQN